MPLKPVFLVGSLLVVAYFGAFVVRAKRLGRQDPVHAPGYARIAWTIFAAMVLAAVLMNAGIALGLIPLLP
jgi:cell division protein FtsW (lipid II flippase)